MKILSVITLSVWIVTVSCQLDLPSSEYLPPQSNDNSAKLTEDGYQYRTVKKLKYRHRRDVSELPNDEYLPPAEDTSVSDPEPVVKPAPEPDPAPAHKLGDKGYEYRGIRRLRYTYRHRRDVSELPNAEYLPPAEDTSASDPEPVVKPAPEPESAPAHKLGDKGYEYRGIRRLRYRYRHRRDVSELPNAEYLPPSEDASASDPEPVVKSAPEPESAPAHKLGDEGYEYRGIRRLRYRYRHRRDVSELPNAEYLPPTEDTSASDQEPVVKSAPKPESAPAHKLGENGYEYRGVRRLRYRYRHRRAVSELPNTEYLPPAEDTSASDPEPVVKPAPPSEPAPAHKLGDKGYEYRGIRRLRYRYRHRRAVSELPNIEYLPPAEDTSASDPEPVVKPAPPSEPTPAHKLGDKGYEYRGIRRLRYRYRHRRDVSNESKDEYLPPVEYLPPIEGTASEPKPGHAFGQDGYRYKSAKKYKLRLRKY